MNTPDRGDVPVTACASAVRFTRLVGAAADRMPESDWQMVAAEVAYLLRHYPLEVEQPVLYGFVQDAVPIFGVEGGRRLARIISSAASAMRPAARMELWQELWQLLKDARPVSAELAAAINTLPDNEEWL